MNKPLPSNYLGEAISPHSDTLQEPALEELVFSYRPTRAVQFEPACGLIIIAGPTWADRRKVTG